METNGFYKVSKHFHTRKLRYFMHCNKVYIISLIITVFTVVFDGYSKIAVKVPKPQELNLNPFTSTLQLIPIAFLDFQGWF